MEKGNLVKEDLVEVVRDYCLQKTEMRACLKRELNEELGRYEPREFWEMEELYKFLQKK